MLPPNTLRPHKRFITTHNDQGQAIFSSELSEDIDRKLLPDGIATFGLGYTTKGFPVELSQDADVDVYKGFLENAPGVIISNGTVLRFVDLGPGKISPMHRTISLDYGVVLEGEVELVLDSGETRLMKRGDVAIQRGTNHAWRNANDSEWCRMMYVLQPAKPLEIGGKTLGEDVSGIQGVRSSD